MHNKKSLRLERISEVIHKELAIIMVKFCQDPRLGKITITNVKVSADLSVAKIYFTNFFNNNNKDNNTKQILEILKNASNFFRTQLAAKSLLRKVPELKFFYDDNAAHATRIEYLLDKLGRNDTRY